MSIFRRRVPLPCTFDLFQEMEKPQRMAYLKLDHWPERCRCKTYGLPWVGLEGVGDGVTIHERDRCQPIREALL